MAIDWSFKDSFPNWFSKTSKQIATFRRHQGPLPLTGSYSIQYKNGFGLTMDAWGWCVVSKALRAPLRCASPSTPSPTLRLCCGSGL